MRPLLVPLAAVLLGAALVAAPPARAADREIRKDVDHALDEVEKVARKLIRQKGIDWKAVRKEMRAAAKDAETVQDEFAILVRMVARLNDGHASVRPAKGVEVRWPDPVERGGPRMFWCRDEDGDVLIKSSWGDTLGAGVKPGMRVVKVADMPVDKWLEQRMTEFRDLTSLSTDHQAQYHLFHWGLMGEKGSLLELELREPKGKKKKARAAMTSRSNAPWGPAVFPEGLERLGRQVYGKLPSGNGYIHLRDVPGELPEQLDTIFAALGEVPGLVLDCRGNGGGGCDHGAVFSRFVPSGEEFGGHEGAGPNPYGGPMVLIVDPGTRSAGETVAGMFKESGRAYAIGPGPTAGMSSGKEMIELPSGRFGLRVSYRSNGRNFNDGDGIEGIGIPPHEIVHWDADALWDGVDPMIARAEELLADFPEDAVKFGK